MRIKNLRNYIFKSFQEEVYKWGDKEVDTYLRDVLNTGPSVFPTNEAKKYYIVARERAKIALSNAGSLQMDYRRYFDKIKIKPFREALPLG